ncbi:phosphatase PAP2 family protein [Bacillaceae bacterium]
MSRLILWLHSKECSLFWLLNRRWRHAALDFFLGKVTHLGGATFTILSALFIGLAAPQPLRRIGLESALALTLSHIPVAIIKRCYPRRRPYLVFPDTTLVTKPLRDYSFPSGHTTAIFSVTVPYMIHLPWLAVPLFLLAAAVAVSRIYLGLHYPSDVIAGSLLGVCGALLAMQISEAWI